MVRERSTNPVNLMPGDELSVVVNRPMLVTIVKEHDDEIVDARTVKEWGTLEGLREEVRALRSQVKHLTWLLNHEGDS